MPLILKPSDSQKLTTRTLASFGPNIKCRDIAVDRAGNMYLALLHPGRFEVLLVMLESGTNRPVQLLSRQVEVPADNLILTLTVTPDGQKMLILQHDGKVFKYNAPFPNAEPQLLAELETKGWRMVADDQSLWVFDQDNLAYRVSLTGGDDGVQRLEVGSSIDTFAPSHASEAGLCVCGSSDASGDITRLHTGDQTSASRTSSVHIQWPPGLQTRCLSKMVVGCGSDGSLLIATSSKRDLNCYTRILHVSPTGHTTLVLGGADPNPEEEEASGSYAWVDVCEGMPGPKPELRLHVVTLDASGHLVGYSLDGHVVRLELSVAVVPALLSGTTPTSSFASCQPTQLEQDWGALLASGQGADVQLRCAGGAVVRAHSHVLLARWEYYRVLQRNLQAGMTGGGSAGEVDVGEHSAATMQLVLQHLYLGEVQLAAAAVLPLAPAADAAEGPSSSAAGAAGGGSKKRGGAGSTSGGSRKRDAQGDAKPATQAGSSSRQADKAVSEAEMPPRGSSELVLLMRAADALLLPELRDACLTAIQQQLSPDNALPLLLAAHQANLESLKEAVMTYAVQHMRAIRDCRTLPVTIKDVIKAAPDLGAELADSLAAVM